MDPDGRPVGAWPDADVTQGAVLGAQALLALGAATEVGLAVGGAVAAGRALAGRGQVVSGGGATREARCHWAVGGDM